MEDADVVIRGHIEEPRIAGSASQLLTQLYSRGRVSQFRYGEVAVGSVDLTPDSHPIDIEGRPQPSISMFGVLTEGVRHFTQYIPSPRSRMRAFEDVGALRGGDPRRRPRERADWRRSTFASAAHPSSVPALASAVPGSTLVGRE